MGVPVGLSVMAWWLGQSWGERPIAAAVPFVLSASWLLRAAWRAGRASGAAARADFEAPRERGEDWSTGAVIDSGPPRGTCFLSTR